MEKRSDPDWAIRDIASKAEISHNSAQKFAQDFRHVVDSLITDDYSILAAPLFEWRPDDPVVSALLGKIDADEGWLDEHDVLAMDDLELAKALELDELTVEHYPIAWAGTILAEVASLYEKEEGTFDEEILAKALWAWLDSFELPSGLMRSYYVSSAGYERDFQKWLFRDLSVLAEWGYRVNDSPADRGPARAEYRFMDRKRADIICRLEGDGDDIRSGDWLVIENKVTMVDLPALTQLQQYVSAAERELAAGSEKVHGLLVADGVTTRLQESLWATGFGYLSLSALGYRDYLRRTRTEAVAGEEDEVRLEMLVSHLPLNVAASSLNEVEKRRRRGPWVINGKEYSGRSEANRALSAFLGSYSREEWEAAQRAHGLR